VLGRLYRGVIAVEYGPTTAYGTSTGVNPPMVANHNAALGSLAAGTLYHYRVKSRDAAGNLGVSRAFTFTTTSAGLVGRDHRFGVRKLYPSMSGGKDWVTQWGKRGRSDALFGHARPFPYPGFSRVDSSERRFILPTRRPISAGKAGIHKGARMAIRAWVHCVGQNQKRAGNDVVAFLSQKGVDVQGFDPYLARGPNFREPGSARRREVPGLPVRLCACLRMRSRWGS
jgi:hypothetical protein